MSTIWTDVIDVLTGYTKTSDVSTDYIKIYTNSFIWVTEDELYNWVTEDGLYNWGTEASIADYTKTEDASTSYTKVADVSTSYTKVEDV